MKKHWLDTEEYPFKSHYFSVNGQQLHYIDEGQGDVLLFVHGTPSWSFDFRQLIKKLRGQYRCIALDHIGFGLSSKPATYDYSTQNHSRTLKKLIDGLQLDQISLVMHDFGGPIGMAYALEQPARIKNLVVLNSWMWSSENEPDYLKIRKILRSPLLPFLYRYLNFSARFVLPGSFGSRKLSKKLLRQYTRPFANKHQRNGTLAFAHSLLHDQAWFESLWQQREQLAHKALLLIWGMKDPVLKPHHLQKFLEGFPHASQLVLPDCGHFPQEEAPEAVTEALLSFLQTG